MFGQALSEEGLATLIAADLNTRAVLFQMNLQLLLRHLTRGARRRHASLPLRRIVAFQWTLVDAVLWALVVEVVYQVAVLVQFSRRLFLLTSRL